MTETPLLAPYLCRSTSQTPFRSSYACEKYHLGELVASHPLFRDFRKGYVYKDQIFRDPVLPTVPLAQADYVFFKASSRLAVVRFFRESGQAGTMRKRNSKVNHSLENTLAVLQNLFEETYIVFHVQFGN